MKATFQNLLTDFKTTFSDAVVTVVFKDRTATAIKATQFTILAMGLSMPDAPNENLSIMSRSDELDAGEPGDPINIGTFGHVVTSYSIDPLGAVHTFGLSRPYDKTATFTGTRRETGSASRELFLATPCIIAGGESIDSQSGSIAPYDERTFSITVRSCDWSDYQPPQAGDAVEVENYPALRVAHCLPVLGGWNVTCRTREAS